LTILSTVCAAKFISVGLATIAIHDQDLIGHRSRGCQASHLRRWPSLSYGTLLEVAGRLTLISNAPRTACRRPPRRVLGEPSEWPARPDRGHAWILTGTRCRVRLRGMSCFLARPTTSRSG